jgi:hypothetical protein
MGSNVANSAAGMHFKLALIWQEPDEAEILHLKAPPVP